MNDFRPLDSDVALLRAARCDPDAFGVFYRRHAVAVERWIRAQTPDMAIAADLTAETFAQALINLHRFRGATDESARGWLYGIARNLVRRYHRRGRVELAICRKLGVQLEHDADELAEIDSRIDAARQTLELTQALNALADTQRRALQLRVVDELDYDEAAALDGHHRAERSHPRVARPANPLHPTRSRPMERVGRQLVAGAHERSPPPRRSRHRAFRLAALSTTGLAVIATAAVLVVGATTRTSPAFAVTRLHDGSVSLKINRRTPLAAVNRKLTAMGIERIGKSNAGGDASSIPNCASRSRRDGRASGSRWQAQARDPATRSTRAFPRAPGSWSTAIADTRPATLPAPRTRPARASRASPGDGEGGRGAGSRSA